MGLPLHLIRNVQVVDGTGAPAYKASVRIRDNRIAEIGDLELYSLGEW